MAELRARVPCRGVIVLALLVLAGGALRFADLDGKSLWRDEAETLIMAGEDYPTLTRLSLELPYIPVPPLFFMATRALAVSPGLPLRWPAALFGLLLIPVAWLLGRELLRPPGPALAAAAVAFAPFFIRYSQEARSYTLLALLGTLAALFLVRAGRSDSRAAWAGFVASTLLALYTHHFALLTLPAAAAWLAVAPRRPGETARGRLCALLATWWVWAGIILLYLPLVRPLLRGLSGPRGLDLEAARAGFGWGDLSSLATVIGPPGLPWAWGVAALAVLGAATGGGWRPGGRALSLLWVGVPTLAVALAPFRHSLRLRYLIFALPAYYFLAAAGLAWLIGRSCPALSSYSSLRSAGLLRGPRFLPRAATAALLTVLAAATLAGVRDYYLREGKQDWRSAALLLGRAASADDLILVDGRAEPRLNTRYRVLDHYAGLGPRVRILHPGQGVARWIGPKATGVGRLWYVNAVPIGTGRGAGDLLPGGAAAWEERGWKMEPPIKFDAGDRPRPAELRWLSPVRHSSVVVVPLLPAGSPGPDGTGRLLELARALPGARPDEAFTGRFAAPGTAP